MYPDLSYFVEGLIGVRIEALGFIKTFGFFLALVFLVGGLIFSKEVERKEGEGLIDGKMEKFIQGAKATFGELFSNGLFGFVLGYKIPYIFANLDAFKVDGAAVLFSPKGNLLIGLLGAALFVFLKYREKEKERLPKPKTIEKKVMLHERTWDLVIMAAISGVAGSKVFAIAETMDQFWADPFGTFFSGSGMAVYGGLIGAFLFIITYLKLKGIKAIYVMDAVAPTLILGYGIGRLGCHFSGDGDWGIVSELASRPSFLAFLPDWLWSFNYPNNVVQDCYSQLADGSIVNGDCKWSETPYLVSPVYPTPLYETMMATCIFAFLWLIRKRIQVAGVLFFIYLFFNGLERYCIETIRVNDRYMLLGFETTQAQAIAISFMVVGLSMIAFLTWRHKQGKPIIF